MQKLEMRLVGLNQLVLLYPLTKNFLMEAKIKEESYALEVELV
jgi:hypothetical protein